jgi:hypothetical protein
MRERAKTKAAAGSRGGFFFIPCPRLSDEARGNGESGQATPCSLNQARQRGHAAADASALYDAR